MLLKNGLVRTVVFTTLKRPGVVKYLIVHHGVCSSVGRTRREGLKDAMEGVRFFRRDVCFVLIPAKIISCRHYAVLERQRCSPTGLRGTKGNGL